MDPGRHDRVRYLRGNVPRATRAASNEFPCCYHGDRLGGRPHKAKESTGGHLPGLPWPIPRYSHLFAYLLFNRGIELVGAARAGQSWHLMPVFGSILAMLFLGESFYLYHAIGIVMIGAGIALASIRVVAPSPQQNLKNGIAMDA